MDEEEEEPTFAAAEDLEDFEEEYLTNEADEEVAPGAFREGRRRSDGSDRASDRKNRRKDRKRPSHRPATPDEDTPSQRPARPSQRPAAPQGPSLRPGVRSAVQ